MTESTPIAALAVPRPWRASLGWQKLPIMELIVLSIAAFLPLVLQDYLTVYATRVLILCLFALSFDLVWGYAGIMSFGQAVFFGSAGYGVCPDRTGSRHHFDLFRPAGRRLDRICLCASARWLSVAGTSSLERHFCLPGHADRLVCGRSSGAGDGIIWVDRTGFRRSRR